MDITAKLSDTEKMCVTFGIVHFPCNYHRQTNFFPTDGSNIWFTEVLVHVSATTCSRPQGAAVFKDIYSIFTWLFFLFGTTALSGSGPPHSQGF